MAKIELKFFRVTELPQAPESNAFYMIRNEDNGDLDLVATGQDGIPVRGLTRDDILAMVGETAIGAVNVSGDGTMQFTPLPGEAINTTFTLANTGVAAGSYNYVTVDAKGRVTTGATKEYIEADENGLVPANKLPSYVDDVIEVDDYTKLPGEVNDPGTNGPASKGKIYVVVEDDVTTIYRWSGTAYIEIPTGVGVADSALKLKTARTIAATGDASWSVNFDGSANVSAAITLANTGVAAGTYSNIEVDAKGRVVAIRALEESDIPGVAVTGSWS